MSRSARIFGFSRSMLLPQAAAGVGSALILHRLVRTWADTPVAVVMLRYNKPDAFLTLLCVAAAWLWSALETGRTRWLLPCSGLLGFAIDTKMLQALLVLPAMALVYPVAEPPKLARRLAQLAAPSTTPAYPAFFGNTAGPGRAGSGRVGEGGRAGGCSGRPGIFRPYYSV